MASATLMPSITMRIRNDMLVAFWDTLAVRICLSKKRKTETERELKFIPSVNQSVFHLIGRSVYALEKDTRKSPKMRSG